MRRSCDIATVALLASGETLAAFLPSPWRVGPFGAFFVAGLCLGIVRHVVWPRPHLGSELRRWLIGEVPDRSVIAGIVLVTRTLVLAAGLVAASVAGYQLAPGQPRIARSEVLNLPARHDAGWYLGIARHGYEWREDRRERQQPVAFFPAYPAGMRLAGDLVTVPAKAFAAPGFLENGNARVLWGGVFLSWLCVLAACMRVAALAAIEIPQLRRARWVVALSMCWPFGLFFSTAYSEAMFLLALAGTLLAWRQERWGRCATWGVLCGLTRSNGWTVSAALLIDLVLVRRGTSRRARTLAALAPAAGAAIYSSYIYYLTGSFTTWIRAQEAWGRDVEPAAFVTRRLQAAATEGFWTYLSRDPSDLLTFVCVAAAVCAAGILLYRRQWLYGTLIVAYLFPAVLIDLPAAGRMTAVLFPMWFAIAGTWRSTALWTAALTGFALQLVLAAYHFVWKPPF